jgi:hypothetical protein
MFEMNSSNELKVETNFQLNEEQTSIIVSSLLELCKGKYRKQENISTVIQIIKGNNTSCIINTDQNLLVILNKIKKFLQDLIQIVNTLNINVNTEISKLLLQFLLCKNKTIHHSITTSQNLSLLSPSELLKTLKHLNLYAKSLTNITNIYTTYIEKSLQRLQINDDLVLYGGYYVPKTCNFELLPLAKINPHPRDESICFDEGPHVYYVKGKKISTSVTGFIHSFFQPFDADDAIHAMIISQQFPFKEKHKVYHSLPLWLLNNKAIEQWEPNATLRSKEEVYSTIKRYWEDNKNQASSDGTKVHNDCERYLNGLPVNNNSVEFGYFVNYVNMMTHYGWVPYRTEQKLWDESVDLAGCADMLWCRPEDKGCKHRKVFLVDWKRSKLIEMMNKYNIKGIGLMSEFDDCNYVHYQLQLNIYKFILEKYYDVEVMGMEIVVFHPNNSHELRYTVPVWIDLIKQIFTEREEQVKKGLHLQHSI